MTYIRFAARVSLRNEHQIPCTKESFAHSRPLDWAWCCRSASLSGPFEAIVDTGADLTIFPIALLHRVKARSTGEGQLRTAFGDVHAITFFLVDLQIEDIILPAVLVASDRSVQEITLGRNVLNKLALLLDGPEQETQILHELELKRLRAKR